MNTLKKFGILSSSENPDNLSTMIKGLIIGATTFIIFGLSRAGVIVDSVQVTEFAVQVGTIAATLVTLYGAIKKLVIFVNDVFHNLPTEDTGVFMDPDVK